MMILRLLLLLCIAHSTFAASSGDVEENVFDGTLPPLEYTRGERTVKAVQFNFKDLHHREWGSAIDADAKGGQYYAPTLMKETNSLDALAGIPGYTGFFHSDPLNPLRDYVVLERDTPVGVFSIGIPSGFYARANLDEAIKMLGLDSGDSTERSTDVMDALIPLRPETNLYLEDEFKAAVDKDVHADTLQFHGDFMFYVLKPFRGKGMGTALVALAKQLTDCLVGQRFRMPQFNPDTKSFTDMLTPPFLGLQSGIARDNLPSLAAHLAIPDPLTIILEREASDLHTMFGWVVLFPKDDSLAPPSNRAIAETALAMEKAHRAVAAGGAAAAASATGGAGSV